MAFIFSSDAAGGVAVAWPGKLGVSVREEEKMSKFAMKRAVKTKAASTTITTSPTTISSVAATCFVSASASSLCPARF